MAALERKVSTLQRELADLHADAQARLEQHKAQLADADRIRREQEYEDLRSLDAAAKDRSNAYSIVFAQNRSLEKAAAALRETQTSKAAAEQALASLKDFEKVVQAELAAEKSQCAKLMEELGALQQQSAGERLAARTESAALKTHVDMLMAEKASLDGKLGSASKAQREAQLKVASLEKEVSMLQNQLADATADAQT